MKGFSFSEPSKTTCTVDGETYKQGQKFYAKDECAVCICTPEFNGKFEGPHCKREVCDAEIRYSEQIEKNCAPVYFLDNKRDVLCRPWTFVCRKYLLNYFKLSKTHTLTTQINLILASEEDKFTGNSNSGNLDWIYN